ncbi:MAG: hypothetical protein H7Z37_06095 [Pyrinomonadaceae bacterium]|nr:hypothetical protein [Pyrinomonadaceae bacterium]
MTKTYFLLLAIFILTTASFAQTQSKNVEIDEDGTSVLAKHLPDFENVRKRATVTTNLSDLQKVTGKRPLLENVDFIAGTEAVTAVYDKSRLVIIEFPSPQLAVENDLKVKQLLSESPSKTNFYRKIGNYGVFVFDAPDENAANALFEQVKYEKNVKWLGDNPFLYQEDKKAEHKSVMTAGDIIISVVTAAGYALFGALVVGSFAGLLVFYWRRRGQDSNETFSDAGGMLRLNLDELSAQTDSKGLLGDGTNKI